MIAKKSIPCSQTAEMRMMLAESEHLKKVRVVKACGWKRERSKIGSEKETEPDQGGFV